MAKDDTKKQFAIQFAARVKAAREVYYKTQKDLADAMGIEQDTYKHWEVDRVIPYHMIGAFAELCKCDLMWLFTDRGERAQKPITQKNTKVSNGKARVQKSRVA